jgi:hypothetical protein
MENKKIINTVIESIREKFLIEYQMNPELYHEIDVNRVRDDNWQIERFILDQKNRDEDKAYEAMVKALRWKKSFGVHERNDQYFPKEFYELHEIEMFGQDKSGRIIHWEITRNIKNIPGFENIAKQFIAHRIEKIDSEASRKGWISIADTSGSGLTNVYLDLYRFKIEVLEYYPQSLRAIFIVDLPSFLNGISKCILSFLSPELKEFVKFINREELMNYVDIDYIPDSLNGKRQKKIYPEGLKALEQLNHLGLTDKQIHKYYDTYKIYS